MPETSIRIMNMVRRTLFEQPQVSDRTLYAAAVAMDPSIAHLSLQQFQARYPRHVRRQEMGERRVTTQDPDVESTLPLGERPYLYAPGSSTLTPQDPPPAAEDGQAAAASMIDQKRGIRRRAQGSRLLQDLRGPVENRPQIVPSDAGTNADATSDGASEDESPGTPWPLRFQPEAANVEPAKRPRLLRAKSHAEPAPARSALTPGSGSATENGSGRGESLRRLREETRRVLLAWAVELAHAETRGDVVRVLNGVGTHVDAIATLWTGQTMRAGAGTTRSAPRPHAPGSTPDAPPPRPAIPQRKNIRDYKRAELDSLVRWVVQTGHHSSDDEVIDAVFAELNFQRRGRRIRTEIEGSLKRVRRKMANA